ncbi:putative serine/threonine-protein phosphatase [Apostichopus japonicus]|uniref:protein-serine/threonine phosphatase n=1 Tax=Stichopus japonicus TaxID=307972 RepID=A0A2G8L9M5_STIJA|nr:putative serine/threonine-protein phosphatase [Apostichopus japonicus]
MADKSSPEETTNGKSTSPSDVSEETAKKAEELKTIANNYFKEDASKALELDRSYIKVEYLRVCCLYRQGIIYPGNASQNAMQNGQIALHFTKMYIAEGYYRRATANLALGKFKIALKDYEMVVKYRPNDKDAKAKYTECNKIVKQQAFERAIRVEDTKKNIADTLDIASMVIDEKYAGPKLTEGKVTRNFAETLLEHFHSENKLDKKYVYQILLQINKLFRTLPTLCDITIPDKAKFTVCGDIHGQFYDLYNIFKLNGLPSEENPYLFNGDFVDRGSFSVEVILTLFCFKLLYPNHFFLSRGNHESETMNQMYGFFGEVRSKYTTQMAELFTEVYNWLPLAHLINKKVLVMHGGLFSSDDVTLEDIRKVDRNRQPPDSGIMCELLWSDPQPQAGRSPSKRGVGIQFGPDITQKFLDHNDLEYVIRSHEVKSDGYEIAHNGKCITVFSAPNYCDTMGNKGAIINMTSDLKPNFVTYEAVEGCTIESTTSETDLSEKKDLVVISCQNTVDWYFEDTLDFFFRAKTDPFGLPAHSWMSDSQRGGSA